MDIIELLLVSIGVLIYMPAVLDFWIISTGLVRLFAVPSVLTVSIAFMS